MSCVESESSIKILLLFKCHFSTANSTLFFFKEQPLMCPNQLVCTLNTGNVCCVPSHEGHAHPDTRDLLDSICDTDKYTAEAPG